MRKALGFAAAAFCGSAVFAGDIDEGLDSVIKVTAPDEVISTLVYLNDQLDTEAFNRDMDELNAPLAMRHHSVVTHLRETAELTQADLLATLADLKAQGRVQDYRSYWIANMIRVDATSNEIEALAARDDVKIVYYNYEIETIAPVRRGEVTGPKTVLAPEPGIDAVRAPEVWNDFGIDGTGVLVSTLDTGVDGNHPALASRWRGLDSRYSNNPEWAFFDPVTGWTFPRDSGSHGTHTMGSVLGGAPGDEIGVAPGAEWIHAAVIDRVSIQRTIDDAILAFQWTADPDGDPNTHWDVPASNSNSWGIQDYHGVPKCDDTFWQPIDNLEAAGVVVIFSAGNEGFSYGLRRPADRATNEYNCMAVASVNANINGWPISSFSSRGPTYCTPNGDPAIKPDISAPGENVRSSVPGNGYANYSGTSMASPHINGVVALMRQANPDLPVDDVKQIIYDTAFDLGDAGEDNNYGWGMVDAYEAVTQAINLRSCMALRVDNLVANDTATFTVRNNITQGDTVMLVYGTGGNGTYYDQNGYCATFDFDFSSQDQILAEGVVDANNEFVANVDMPYFWANQEIMFQAAKRDTCPDECMSHVLTRTVGGPPECMNLQVDNLVAGETATFTLTENIVRGDYVAILWGTGGAPETINALDYCATFWFDLPGNPNSRVVGKGYVDQNDEFIKQVNVPANLSGMDIIFQGTKRGTCPDECMSNFVDTTIQ